MYNIVTSPLCAGLSCTCFVRRAEVSNAKVHCNRVSVARNVYRTHHYLYSTRYFRLEPQIPVTVQTIRATYIETAERYKKKHLNSIEYSDSKQVMQCIK